MLKSSMQMFARYYFHNSSTTGKAPAQDFFSNTRESSEHKWSQIERVGDQEEVEAEFTPRDSQRVEQEPSGSPSVRCPVEIPKLHLQTIDALKRGGKDPLCDEKCAVILLAQQMQGICLGHCMTLENPLPQLYRSRACCARGGSAANGFAELAGPSA